MMFKERLTKRQYQSIIFIILGILFIYLIYVNSSDFRQIALIFAFVLVVISIGNFLEDTIKKYKIVRAYNTKNYDSKGEKQIAEYFERKNIKFYLHPVIKLQKTFWIFQPPFMKIKIRPDFFLPEYNVFVEYWGMIEDSEYKKKQFDFKKKLYFDNSIDFISLYPKNLQGDNLDWVFTQKLLDLFKTREGISQHWK